MRRSKCLLTIVILGLVFVVTACASASPVSQATPPLTEPPSPTATVLRPTPTPTAPRASLDLRTVDWATFVASDPNLDHPNFSAPGYPAYPPARPDLGPLVAGKSSSFGMGYALINKILYAIFSDQGQLAAVIPIYDTDQTHNLGFLIYVAGNDAPLLVAILGGYNTHATIDAGQLVVTEDIRQSFGPTINYFGACGYLETHSRIQSNQLIVMSQKSWGEPACRQLVVRWFYDQLRSKQFQSAYAMLSPVFQSANPYDQWIEGYQNTVSLSIKSSERSDGLIGVEISSTEKTPTGHKPLSFKGTWSLVWSSNVRQWLLDKPNIVNVPLTGARALDWTQIIATEPSLAHPDKDFDLWGLTPGPLVAADKDLSKGYGFAMVDDIFYANIMGSTQDQAFVWLEDYPAFRECYGTIHTGLLIYKTDSGKPKLAATIWGYELSAVTQDNKLIIRDMAPPDFGITGKCDTSGFRETRYRWQSDQLVPESFFEVSYEGPPIIDVAKSFYDLLQAKEYTAAYALLSPAFQAANPFDRWVAGYRDIISIDVAYSTYPEKGSEGDDSTTVEIAPGFVEANVTSIEQADSGQITRHFTDKWILITYSKSPPVQEYLDHLENIPSP